MCQCAYTGSLTKFGIPRVVRVPSVKIGASTVVGDATVCVSDNDFIGMAANWLD